MGAGCRQAYRWLTEYLPERMLNQMKELSSIAYTWWGGAEHVSQQLWGLTPTPGGRESGRPHHAQACSSLVPVQGEPCGSPGPWGWGPRVSVRATVKARPRPIRVETTFPCALRKLWIPCRQSWAEDSVWAQPAPASRGSAPLQGRGAAAATGTQARGAACPRTTAPGSGQVLKTGKDSRMEPASVGMTGSRGPAGPASEWPLSAVLGCVSAPPGQAESQLLRIPGTRLRVRKGHWLTGRGVLAASGTSPASPGHCVHRGTLSPGKREGPAPALNHSEAAFGSGEGLGVWGQAGAGGAVGQAGLGSEARG